MKGNVSFMFAVVLGSVSSEAYLSLRLKHVAAENVALSVSGYITEYL